MNRGKTLRSWIHKMSRQWRDSDNALLRWTLWFGQCHDSHNAWLQPLPSYGQRVDAMLRLSFCSLSFSALVILLRFVYHFVLRITFCAISFSTLVCFLCFDSVLPLLQLYYCDSDIILCFGYHSVLWLFCYLVIILWCFGYHSVLTA